MIIIFYLALVISNKLASELWIARDKLSVPVKEAAVKNHGSKDPRFTWTGFCFHSRKIK